MHDFTHPTEPSQQFIIKRGEGVFTLEFNTSEQKKCYCFSFLPKVCWPSDTFPGDSSHQHEKVLGELYIFFVVCETGMFPDTYVEPG